MLLSCLTPDTSAFRLCILLIVKKDKNVKVVHQVEKFLFVFIEVKNGSVAALVILFVVIAAAVIVLWLGGLFVLFAYWTVSPVIKNLIKDAGHYIEGQSLRWETPFFSETY